MLRVTARLAHRLGTTAPIQRPFTGNNARAGECETSAEAGTGARTGGSARQCKAKCVVLALGLLAMAAWNWARF